ncbi:hypothetical protein LCGC14_1446740, partial [marine sediment metagenome]
MTAKDKLQDTLTGLADELSSLDAADKAGIAQAGVRLEQASGSAPHDAGSDAEALRQALEALQGVYEDQAPDPARTLQAVAGVVRSVEQPATTSSDEARARTIADALTALSASLEARTDDPGDDPGGASLDEVAALLVSLTPADTEGLNQVLGQIAQVGSAGSFPASVRGLAKAAGDHIQAILEGSAEDADAALAAAGEELGLALKVAEEGVVEVAAAPSGEPEAAPDRSTQELPPGGEDFDLPGETGPEGEAAPSADEAAFEYAKELPADSDLELLGEYIAECLDHVTAAEAALLNLETDPEDTEQVNTIFRGFHTIKGTSGFLGLDAVGRLAHLAENLLDRARSGEIRISGGYADLALESCDMLRSLIEGLGGLQPGDPLVITDGFEGLLARLTDPRCDETDATTVRLGDILVAEGTVSRADVETAAEEQAERKIGMTLVEKGQAPAKDVARALRTQQKIAGASTETTIRVATGRLDSLINMTGELVIAQSMVAQDPLVLEGANPRLAGNVTSTGKIVRELQDLTMSLRMVPLAGTFQKMTRLVRDLARKSGKSVRLVTEGEDTEIDRNMVESLKDPLIHMMRNAVAHGIEPAEERRRTGKPQAGTVSLRAYHAGGHVVIEVADDGKGLDPGAIAARAAELGLVEPRTDLSDNDAFSMLFEPGFTTAEQATDVSGRGVGLDVVRKAVEALRGRVEVASGPGEGCVFTLRLPLTLAVTDAMLLRVGDERFLLPTASIEQSFRPGASSVTTVMGRGELVTFRGGLLPVFR